MGGTRLLSLNVILIGDENGHHLPPREFLAFNEDIHRLIGRRLGLGSTYVVAVFLANSYRKSNDCRCSRDHISKPEHAVFAWGRSDPRRLVTFNQLSQEQKHSTIRSEVLKLLRFPNASGGLPSQTSVIEQLLVNKLPQKMFSLLIQFDGKDVSGLPKIGAQLDNHLASYDRFHEECTQLEKDLLPRIGDMVRVSFREGWRIYFRYVVMRFAERSKEDIIRDGNFLNYEITWDDAERVFIELNKKSAVRDRFVKIFRLYNEMILSLATLNKVMVGG